MPTNNFNDLNATSTIIAFLAGIWGAMLNFLKRDTKKLSIVKKISFFFMDMSISMGFTLLAYLGLVGYGLNDLTAVAISGFIGHLGTRSTYLVELMIAEKLGAKDTFEEIKKGKIDV